MKAIEIKNLKKYFGKKKAVDNIDLEINEGEIFGFLGPNGAGKTTTIRCMMDFLKPTDGSISILGLDSQKDSVNLKNKIGYLTSDIRLYDNWSGKDHLDFIQKFRGKSKILPSLIKRFDYNPKVKVKQLSTGNKQKLGLIMALMNEPKILILDEPTRGLDPILQNSFYETLLEFKEKGATVFFSSHNLSEVDKVCQKVAIIKSGKIVANESIESLKQKSIHMVYAYFNQEFKKSDFNFDGVEVVEKLKDGLVLKVKGNLDNLVKKLAHYKLKDLEISHANLEDIFLNYYKD